MKSTARELGIFGGIFGVLIGAWLLWAVLVITQAYYTGAYYYFDNAGSIILLLFLVCFGILGFSIIGALGAAQKLDSRPTVNAGGLFVAGVVVLLCLLSIAIPGIRGGGTSDFSYSAVFVFAGLVISVSFFLSGYLLLRKPAS